MEHISKSKVIVSRQDWLLWQRENAVKKECQDRLKNKNLSPTQHRNIWLHIKTTTESLDVRN